MADDDKSGDSTDLSARRESEPSTPQPGGTPSAVQSQSSSTYQLASSSQQSEGARRRQQEGYGTISRQPGSAEPGPTRQPTLKKPTVSRKPSSHLPYKGQEFSVDDAENEFAEDLEKKRQQDRDRERERLQRGASSLRSNPTLRRRTTNQMPTLSQVVSFQEDDDDDDMPTPKASEQQQQPPDMSREEDEEDEDEENDVEDDEMDTLSEAESFTLKDRQDAINVTHPFGIRIWKPALYKKNRSVQKTAEDEIHSSPGGHVNHWLWFFNFLWTLVFGWWLALLALIGSVLFLAASCFSDAAGAYGAVLWGLSKYFFYPFGKYVKLESDDAYREEDEGEGRSISEYERWQSGDLEEGRLFFGPVNRSLVGRRRASVESADETQSLLGRSGHDSGQDNGANNPQRKKRLFGRGKWNPPRVLFYMFFYCFLAPAILITSFFCWLLVFTIPMGKVTLLLIDHLQKHPLALSFHSDSHDTRHPGEGPSAILVCTYRAVGLRYWKYTIDGTNIFLINLNFIVAFTIVDYFVLHEFLGWHIPLTNQGFMFCLGLFSVIPLAYFIGQAVASISAQSTMGVGATVNAFFSTVVEVFLYCVALDDGKAQLVEGSIIGSIFAGIMFLPGLSMCFGALKRKTQRFNAQSAGVTSTMLLFAMIGAFSPTLFYQIHGSHELKCHDCTEQDASGSSEHDCRRCYFQQTPAVHDSFYNNAVLPYIWISATFLFLSYVMGLLFTLRTHASVIWSQETDEKRGDHMNHSHSTSHHPEIQTLTRQTTSGTIVTIPSNAAHSRGDVRDTQLYQRILGQSLRHTGLSNSGSGSKDANASSASNAGRPDGQSEGVKSPHIVPPKSPRHEIASLNLEALSEEDNNLLSRHVAEVAATAATVAARDTAKTVAKKSPHTSAATQSKPQNRTTAEILDDAMHAENPQGNAGAGGHGGHDAPNWSRVKSATILLIATVAYAVIAEVLVNTVDSVLENVDVDEKFLGITLFALVPNTTEFLNAISFAVNGNIALSMEIGSAYALQVCLLQIPALVLFSGIRGAIIPDDVGDHTFSLIFPQWDMVTVILSIFLLSYMYGEGKSNYFKGSILIFAYVVIVFGFWSASYDIEGKARGVNSSDTLAIGSWTQLQGLVRSGRHGFEL